MLMNKSDIERYFNILESRLPKGLPYDPTNEFRQRLLVILNADNLTSLQLELDLSWEYLLAVIIKYRPDKFLKYTDKILDEDWAFYGILIAEYAPDMVDICLDNVFKYYSLKSQRPSIIEILITLATHHPDLLEKYEDLIFREGIQDNIKFRLVYLGYNSWVTYYKNKGWFE